MAQTKAGAMKAKETNYLRYGPDYYIKLGELGGKKSRGGGFAANHELAREAGRKGGSRSRRGAVTITPTYQATPEVQIQAKVQKTSLWDKVKMFLSVTD